MAEYSMEQKMVILAYGAYCQFWENSAEKLYDGLKVFLENSEVNKKLIWGPAISRGFIFTNALMYIVQDCDAEEDFTLVIRGTSPFSLATWIFQDIDVEAMIPWNMVTKTNYLTDDIKISKAAASSILIHHSLVPQPGLPGEGENFVEFLFRTLSGGEKGGKIADFLSRISNRKKIRLRFTGHSLGGLLSSTLALWLFDSYPELRNKIDMDIYSFAALTAGNKAFAEHSDNVLGDSCRRFYNELDLAVHAWDSESLFRFSKLYKQQFFWNRGSRNKLIKTAKRIAFLGYKQVGRAFPVPADHFFKWNYIAEVVYQHVVTYPYAILKGELVLKLLTDLLVSSFLLKGAGNAAWGIKRKFRNLISRFQKKDEAEASTSS